MSGSGKGSLAGADRAHFRRSTVITNVVRIAADYSFSRGFRDIVLVFRESEDNVSNVRFPPRFISESLLRNPGARIRFLIQPLFPGQSPEEVFKRTPALVYERRTMP